MTARRLSEHDPAAKAAHREISARYAWDRRRRLGFVPRGTFRMMVRIREIERLLAARWGTTLPDDDAGRDDLVVVANTIAGGYPEGDVAGRIVAWASAWAPWLPAAEARALAERAAARPCRFKADTLGRRMGLTEAERTSHRITTVWAVDAGETPAQRRSRRDRERKARKRAAERTARPEPASRVRPWEAEGVSRRTWYRRRAKAGGTKPVRSRSVAIAVDNISATARGGRGGPSTKDVSGQAPCPKLASERRVTAPEGADGALWPREVAAW